MRPLIHKSQVFKLRPLVLWFFLFLSPTTMSSIKDQFVAEEARMATEEAELVEWRAAAEKARQEAEEEQRWKEEEEWKWKEEEERKWKEEERLEEEWQWKEEEEKRHQEVEKQKRVEEEKRQKEEELWKQVDVEKQKQSEAEEQQEAGDKEGNQAVEVAKKQWAEAHLHETWIADQMVWAAQAKSSKQTTQDFTYVALAYWRSQGMAFVNWPYVQLGPIGTNRHVSGLFLDPSEANIF